MELENRVGILNQDRAAVQVVTGHVAVLDREVHQLDLDGVGAVRLKPERTAVVCSVDQRPLRLIALACEPNRAADAEGDGVVERQGSTRQRDEILRRLPGIAAEERAVVARRDDRLSQGARTVIHELVGGRVNQDHRRIARRCDREPAAADQQRRNQGPPSPGRHCTSRSRPGPPLSLSLPGPPRSTSLPAWPRSLSLPLPPISLSLPAAPQRMSLPPLPLIVSLPPRPAITSAFLVPTILPLPLVPTLLAFLPPHRAVEAVFGPTDPSQAPTSQGPGKRST